MFSKTCGKDNGYILLTRQLSFCRWLFMSPTSVGRDIIKWCHSVPLSVTCLDLTGERKGLESPKLAKWKHIASVTREPI